MNCIEYFFVYLGLGLYCSLVISTIVLIHSVVKQVLDETWNNDT